MCAIVCLVTVLVVLSCLLPALCLGLQPQHASSTAHDTSLCHCTPQPLDTAAACAEGYHLQHHSSRLPAAPDNSAVAAEPDHHGPYGCCVPNPCPSTAPDALTAPPAAWQQGVRQGSQHTPARQQAALPPPDWMSQCCSDMLLRNMFLPGTHDSGTYMWTTPKHMPLVLDEILAILFNIVGDLSRTQRLDVYQQLQAGARVLDVRLAVSPWIAVAARQQQAAKRGSSSSSHVHSKAVAADAVDAHVWSRHADHTNAVRPGRKSSRCPFTSLLSWFARARVDAVKAIRVVIGSSSSPHQPPQSAAAPDKPSPALFELDPVLLEGYLDMAAVGGPLTVAEREGCIVTSHSLPAAPLVDVLRDVRRFLAENPGELVVLLVKADTIDVNVAGSKRFTQQDWAAAAAVFERELQGVQLVDEQQVQLLTLGQLAVGSQGGGSVLLYSRELQQQGLKSVDSRRVHILESWFNGTNTDDVDQLKQRLIDWLTFWRSAHWRQYKKPFLLLASAEVTLGVRTILDMIKNRIWGWQQQAAALEQEVALAAGPAAAAADQRRQLQRALAQWQQLVQQYTDKHGLWTAAAGRMTAVQRPQQQQRLWSQHQHRSLSVGMLASGMTTLYQLGIETNKQILQDVLQSNEVPKDFNVWSLDAISADIANYIIGLNSKPSPTQQQHQQ